MVMTKKELIRFVAIETGFSNDEVSNVLDSITTTIGNSLIGGEEVKISEFGTFKIKEVASRRNINIATGEEQYTRESHVIKFLPCGELKNAVR